jgi:hypothetical protein
MNFFFLKKKKGAVYTPRGFFGLRNNFEQKARDKI